MPNYASPRSDAGVFANWPDCSVEGCQHKCCLALDSNKCFEHTPGNYHVKLMKIDAVSAAYDGE